MCFVDTGAVAVIESSVLNLLLISIYLLSADGTVGIAMLLTTTSAIVNDAVVEYQGSAAILVVSAEPLMCMIYRLVLLFPLCA